MLAQAKNRSIIHLADDDDDVDADDGDSGGDSGDDVAYFCSVSSQMHPGCIYLNHLAFISALSIMAPHASPRVVQLLNPNNREVQNVEHRLIWRLSLLPPAPTPPRVLNHFWFQVGVPRDQRHRHIVVPGEVQLDSKPVNSTPPTRQNPIVNKEKCQK